MSEESQQYNPYQDRRAVKATRLWPLPFVLVGGICFRLKWVMDDLVRHVAYIWLKHPQDFGPKKLSNWIPLAEYIRCLAEGIDPLLYLTRHQVKLYLKLGGHTYFYEWPQLGPMVMKLGGGKYAAAGVKKGGQSFFFVGDTLRAAEEQLLLGYEHDLTTADRAAVYMEEKVGVIPHEQYVARKELEDLGRPPKVFAHPGVSLATETLRLYNERMRRSRAEMEAAGVEVQGLGGMGEILTFRDQMAPPQSPGRVVMGIDAAAMETLNNGGSIPVSVRFVEDGTAAVHVQGHAPNARAVAEARAAEMAAEARRAQLQALNAAQSPQAQMAAIGIDYEEEQARVVAEMEAMPDERPLGERPLNAPAPRECAPFEEIFPSIGELERDPRIRLAHSMGQRVDVAVPKGGGPCHAKVYPLNASAYAPAGPLESHLLDSKTAQLAFERLGEELLDEEDED
jgi:hypothetical protein